MNLKTDIRRLDRRWHRWEHNMVMSGEKLIHQETFWLAVMIVGMIAFFTLLMIMGLKSASPRNTLPTPFGPMY